MADGYEAATWREHPCTKLDFWRWTVADEHWTRIGRATIPTNPELGLCAPDLSGRRLYGAVDATFIAANCFTGDGAVRAAAFSNGPHGWGVVSGNGLRYIASRGGSQRPAHWPPDSVREGIQFHGGELETINGSNGFLSDAGAATYPMVEDWRWTGAGYAGVSNNEFLSEPTRRPHTVRSLPGWCPMNGVYRATVGVRVDWIDNRHTDPPLHLYAFRRDAPRHEQALCEWRIWPNFPITVIESHNDDRARWMTAPAWMFAAAQNGDGATLQWFNSDGDTAPGYAAFAVPQRFGFNEIDSSLQKARLPLSFTGSGQIRHHLAHGAVTIHDGNIAGLSVNPAPSEP